MDVYFNNCNQMIIYQPNETLFLLGIPVYNSINRDALRVRQ